MPQRIGRYFILWSSLPKITRRALIVSASILLLSAVSAQRYAGTAQAQADEAARPLELGNPLKRELAGGRAHHYQVLLTANQFLQVVVNQRGIDAVVVVFGPDDKKIIEADSLLGNEGPEQVSMVAGMAGTYRIEVSSLKKDAQAGHYWIKVEELRPVIPQDSSRGEAEKMFLEATSLFGQASAGSQQKAIRKFENTLLLFQSLNDPIGQARVLQSLAAIYRSLVERQKELDCIRRALPNWEAAGYHYVVGITLDRLGVIYANINEMQKSIDSFERELPYWKAMAEPMKEANALNNIAIILYSTGENQKALSYYAKVLQIVEAADDNQGQAATLTNIGKVYDDLGEKQKSIEAYNKALELSKRVEDFRTQGITLRYIGSLYFSLGETEKALDKYTEAIPLHEKAKDAVGKALSLNRIGMVWSFKGDTQKAFEYYEQALAQIRSVKNVNSRWEGYILNNIGAVYSSRGEYQKAFEYYNQAVRLFQMSVDPLGEARTLNNIGKVYINLRDEQKALDHLNKALSINRAVGHKSEEADSHYLIAQAERNRGNLTEALANIDAALETVETLRVRIDADELRQSYFESVQDYYDFKIDLLMRLDKLAPSKRYAADAFQTSERASARTLLERLVEAGVDIRQGVDPVLLQRQQALQQSINALASGRQLGQLRGEQRAEKAAAAAKEIEKLTSDYQELKAQIRTSSPRYAALTQPQPLSLSDIQERVLDDDTLLLEYSLGQERSYLWAVTKRSIDSFVLPSQKEIEAAARRLYSFLTVRNSPRGKFETVEEQKEKIRLSDNKVYEAAAILSRMVLQPVAAKLKNKRLLIVADGALQYIPFAVLTTAAEYTPLIANHEIVSLPSASTLAVLRRELDGRKPAPKAFAVLADPVFSKDDERIRNRNVSTRTTQMQSKSAIKDGDSGLRNVNLDRLRHTRQEAEAILALSSQAECKVALDFEADRALATSAELSEYRFIHFATHSFLDDLHPELSGIVLSLVDKEGADRDGILRAIDIFNLKFPAELVVLSACQTGLGKEIRGEGLVGLTRSFMYAGAARVMVSLWDVNDKATAELMERFYHYMLGKQRLRPAAALREAQLAIWKENPRKSPYYWAAFVIQGEW